MKVLIRNKSKVLQWMCDTVNQPSMLGHRPQRPVEWLLFFHFSFFTCTRCDINYIARNANKPLICLQLLFSVMKGSFFNKKNQLQVIESRLKIVLRIQLGPYQEISNQARDCRSVAHTCFLVSHMNHGHSLDLEHNVSIIQCTYNLVKQQLSR